MLKSLGNMKNKAGELVSQKFGVLLFLLLAVASNILGVLFPVLLATVLTHPQYGDFSLGALSGAVGFAISSYGFENTLLRVSATSQGREKIVASWIIRFFMLCIFCACTWVFFESSMQIWSAVWAALPSLYNRGYYDYRNKQLNFIVHILIDRLSAISVIAGISFGVFSDVSAIFIVLILTRCAVIVVSSAGLLGDKTNLKKIWVFTIGLLRSNFSQAVTMVILAGVSVGAPLVLANILSKQATAKYYFVYQFGYLIPVVYGYLSRYLYVRMYHEAYDFRVIRKRLRMTLTAFWGVCAIGVVLCFFIAKSTAAFPSAYFDYKLLFIFLGWNLIFMHGAYLSAYLISRHGDWIILKANILAVPILAALSFWLIKLFSEHGAALAMLVTHACVISMYWLGIRSDESARKNDFGFIS